MESKDVTHKEFAIAASSEQVVIEFASEPDDQTAFAIKLTKDQAQAIADHIRRIWE